MKFKYIKKHVRVEPSSKRRNGTKFAEFILSNTSAAAEDNTAESACTELQCCSAAVLQCTESPSAVNQGFGKF